MLKISTYLDHTNYTAHSNGDELVIRNGGMLLPINWNEDKGVAMKYRGDVYIQFYCHIKSKYGLEEIRNSSLDYTEFIDREKQLVYRVKIFDLTMFLNSILIDSTICVSTGKGYIQWFRKPIEKKVNEFIENNIIKKQNEYEKLIF